MAECNSTQRRRWPQDLTGMRFGKLTAVKKDPDKKKTQWICQCDCGSICSIRPHLMFYGYTQSCGCLGRERSSKRMTSHGMSRTPLYNAWWGMVYRGSGRTKYSCYSEVRICERWKKFENFYEDMGDKPSPSHSIDRIENSGDYTCGKCEECISRGDKMNCRWATKQEQSINRSVTHFITLDGETHTLTEWARVKGLKLSTLFNRLKNGWSERDALTKPASTKRKPRKPESTTEVMHNVLDLSQSTIQT